MAILEKLRVKAGLLVAIIIFLSLLAFVLSDFLDSSGSLFTRSKYEIAEVFGKSVPYTEYDSKVKELEDIQKLQSGQVLNEEANDQIRSVTWDNMIQDMLLEKQYDKLGLDVSKEELSNMILGDHPHPAIAQLFTDPRTGVLNRQALNQFVRNINSEDFSNSDEKKVYDYIVNEIYRQRKNLKYMNLIRKGFYATDFDINKQQQEATQSVDLNFIVERFNTISDSTITVSASDLKAYYKQHINSFKQKESRDIRYVYFEVTPSKNDFKAAQNKINDVQADFEKADDIASFVSMESDIPFDEKNYSLKELPDTLKPLFNAAVGTSFGPYFADNSYRISRVAAIHFLPDSVKARHILLRANQNNAQGMFKLADSLATLIRKGANFGELAMKYSADQSAQTGGDLGWFKEGDMVKSISDSCFKARKGEVKVVTSQYGIHVVQVIDQANPSKKVQIGTLVKNVVASEQTDHDYYVKANEFAGLNNTYDKFIKAIDAEKLTANMQLALNIDPMQKRINDMDQARNLVLWAYKAEEKDISTVLKIGNKYVVAALEKARKEGPAPLADIKTTIENKVRQQKKGESLVAKIESKKASSIEGLAKDLNLNVEPVSGLRFNSPALGTAGVEPNVIAAAVTLPKNTVSKPIIGENGVYVLNVSNVTAPTPVDKQTILLARNYLERSYAAKANYFAFEALKELAHIRDNRREFF